MELGLVKKCRICEGAELEPFFDLGNQPFANSLLKSQDDVEKAYPLALCQCRGCGLVQLTYTADPAELFSNYVWVTGTSKTTLEYAEIFFSEFLKRAINTDNSYVLEVASNDGSFLLPFLRNNYKVLGVDPAQNIADGANSAGIPTRCAFFGLSEAEKITDENGQSKMVFARNVLPHVADQRDFVAGLSKVLHQEGVLAVEVHYAGIILKELHYDSVYHEHICYFTLKTLSRLLADFGLYVFDAVKSPISGGSIVVFASKEKSRLSSQVIDFLNQEIESGVNDFESWKNFASKSIQHRNDFLEILNKQLSENKITAGWGASARSSTLLNFARVNNKMISLIADQNPLKQGLYTAGSKILIKSPDEVMKSNPELMVVLAWNFGPEIMKTLKEKFNFTGNCLLPLPGSPRLIKAADLSLV